MNFCIKVYTSPMIRNLIVTLADTVPDGSSPSSFARILDITWAGGERRHQDPAVVFLCDTRNSDHPRRHVISWSLSRGKKITSPASSDIAGRIQGESLSHSIFRRCAVVL